MKKLSSYLPTKTPHSTFERFLTQKATRLYSFLVKVWCLLLCLLLVAQTSWGNMASPIWEGTSSASAFSSKDIDILKEYIHIKIAPDFKTAQYEVIYTIRTDRSGQQIPLLFLAQDYLGEFSVTLNGQSIKLQPIPETSSTNRAPFSSFADTFEESTTEGQPSTISIYWEENVGNVYNLSDLKYFEVDLAKGTHTIRVTYTANAWVELTDWVKEYSFRYSLTPAQYWNSFGQLDVKVTQQGVPQLLTSNLPKPAEGNIGKSSTWTFRQLPAAFLQFSYQPEISPVATALIQIHPTGIALSLGTILILLHIWWITHYRKAFPSKRFSVAVMAGSLLIPPLIFAGYVYSFPLIDSFIGPEASNYHGYMILTFALLPFLLPLYFIAAWFFDRHIKQRLRNI
ncbi:MAG: hypothetical protein ACFB0B_12310 [Thermonemataceae bacterium]